MPLFKKKEKRWFLYAQTGFTVFEIVIVLGVLSLIAAMGVFVLNNQKLGNLESDAQIIASRLAGAQTRAISAVNGSAWGIHFDNTTSSAPWYALFQGTNYVSSTELYYLTNSIAFQTPTAGSSSTIIFTKLNGNVSTSSVVIIQLVNDSTQTKIISVSAQGKISTQ